MHRDVFRTSELVAAGASYRQLARAVGDTWERTHRGVLVAKASTLANRDLRIALCAVGGDAAISHVSAGRVHRLPGVDGLPGFWRPRAHVDITVPRTRSVRAHSGVELHRHDLESREVVEIAGLPVTSLMRTVLDLLLTQPPELTVVVLDSLLASGRFTAEHLHRLGLRTRGRHGVRRAQQALAMCDARSESPLESLSRIRFVRRGLVPSAIQYEVKNEAGRLVARSDFGFGEPRPWVLGEADGLSIHDVRDARVRDARREEQVRLLGYQVVRWTWGELATNPETIIKRLHSFLALGCPPSLSGVA